MDRKLIPNEAVPGFAKLSSAKPSTKAGTSSTEQVDDESPSFQLFKVCGENPSPSDDVACDLIQKSISQENGVSGLNNSYGPEKRTYN